jgi:hypothetical protein
MFALGTAQPLYALQPLLPDPKLTPGKVAAGPRDTRGVTAAMRDKVFARYRIPPDRRSAYTIDHLIPKELGGADAVENLWPQRLNGRPYNPHRKELLARKLMQLISNGQMTLAQAQQEIREDWISAFVVHIGMVHLTPGKLTASE